MTGVSPAVAYRLATTDTTPKLVLTAQCVPWPHSAVESTHNVYINVKESVKEKFNAIILAKNTLLTSDGLNSSAQYGIRNYLFFLQPNMFH